MAAPGSRLPRKLSLIANKTKGALLCAPFVFNSRIASYNLVMDVGELHLALTRHFAAKGFVERPADSLGLGLLFAGGAERWGLALCPDREEGMAYLGAFEAAMQRAVDARQKAGEDLKLGLGVAFASTAAGQSPSYRRALKKYSNSIVFEDLGLSLFLVTGEQTMEVLAPMDVNPFLRNLDTWIAGRSA